MGIYFEMKINISQNLTKKLPWAEFLVIFRYFMSSDKELIPKNILRQNKFLKFGNYDFNHHILYSLIVLLMQIL